MSIFGGVFVSCAWMYVFLLVFVHFTLSEHSEGSFDAFLESAELLTRPTWLAVQLVGIVAFYEFGSWFFGWVVGTIA